jgi:transposase-like protein
METIIKIECSYCKKDMGTKDGNGTTGVSHSICQECAEKILAEFKEE